MKSTITLEQASERLAQRESTYSDILAKPTNLEYWEGMLHVKHSEGEQAFDLHPWAESQLCKRLGIPVSYFRKCPQYLQDLQFDHWIDTLNSKNELLLRLTGNTIRGILSERYSIINDKRLLDAVTPMLKERYIITWFEMMDVSFHLRLVDPTLMRGVDHADPLFVGVHISNSEVGMRCLSVDSLVYRQVCKNGMVKLQESGSILRRRHSGKPSENLEFEVLNAARSALNLATDAVHRFDKTKLRIVENPPERVSSLARAWDLSESVQQSIIDQLSAEAFPETEYAVINAITSIAQGFEPDERLHLETLAGSLI